MGTMKFEVHFQNFLEVLKRSGCGGTIYLGITREESHIFYNLILLQQVSILLTANLVAMKRDNYDPILIVKRT